MQLIPQLSRARVPPGGALHLARASTSRSRRSTLLQLTNILYYFTAQFHRPSMLYSPDQKGHSSKYAPAAQHSRPRQVLLTPPLRLQIVRHIRKISDMAFIHCRAQNRLEARSTWESLVHVLEAEVGFPSSGARCQLCKIERWRR
jgi:hypothetical protein